MLSLFLSETTEAEKFDMVLELISGLSPHTLPDTHTLFCFDRVLGKSSESTHFQIHTLFCFDRVLGKSSESTHFQIHTHCSVLIGC